MLLAPASVITDKNASKLFWLFVLLHFVCWTVIPTLIQPNAPLDTVEGFVWGYEMQWGYYKHPPMQAWLLQAATHLFGNSGLGYFGLSALTACITFWAIYRTARLFTTKTKALIATLLCEGIVYFNFLSTEFNPNVLQLMKWALCGYAFSYAILRDKLKYWVLFGALFALGFYAKYSIALLGIGFGLFILIYRDARHVLATPKPYIALAVFILLLLPHVFWLHDHNYLPFTYAMSRSEAAKDIFERLFFPVKFTLSQLLDMLPMLLLAATLFDRKHPAPQQAKLRRRLLAFLAFAPLALNFVISLITGHRALDMWGMPYLSFIPLWIVVNAPMDFSQIKLRNFSIAWGIVFTLTLTAFVVSMVYGTALGFKPMRGHFPGSALSRLIHEKWQQEVGPSGGTLSYVISDAWLGGNVALYAPDINNRPHVFIDGDTTNSPWIDKEDVARKGAVVIWRNKDARPAYLADYNGPIETTELPWQTVTNMPPTRIYWAIIKPKQVDKSP